MGIHNLLPFVSKACRQGNINELSYQSVAVDVSCLLHRGLIGCADKIAQGHETDFYIRYVMKYVKALLANHCHVILVFDGQPLPAKQGTNSSRREKRDFNKQRGDLLMSQGRASEAYDFFKRGASLTTEIIENAIQAFRQINMVDVIVSPYESDAQLTYLTRAKLAQAVVTEDSDLIAFGCEKIIFKMDISGSCTIFERKLLPKCLCRALAENFDFDKFRRICILSGCDYLKDGLPGVGLNKAAAFFAKTSSKNLYQVLPRLPRYLNMNSLKVTRQFIADFIRAENTFLYQIVFDPIERRQRPLHDYPLSQQSIESDNDFQSSSQGSVDDLTYAGDIQPSEIAISHALGNIPGGSQTEKICLSENVPDWSIWSSNYKTVEERQKAKCDKEINRKACGAFMLTFSESFTKKMSEHMVGTPRPSAVRISNCSTVKSTVITSTSTVDEDDFIIQKNMDDSHKNSLAEAKIDCKRSLVRTIGNSKTGNGALRKWNCDLLLKEFASQTARSSVGSFNETVDEIAAKKARIALEDENFDEDADVVPIAPIAKTSYALPKNSSGSFCSKYFSNKGSKTSGLSRRSVSSLHAVPSASHPKQSQLYKNDICRITGKESIVCVPKN